MKQSINKLFANMALAGAFSLTLLASQASASFLDYDHSAASVNPDSVPVETSSPMQGNGFIDYDHSAESVSDGNMKPGSKQSANDTDAMRSCGFIDCDHSPHGIQS